MPAVRGSRGAVLLGTLGLLATALVGCTADGSPRPAGIQPVRGCTSLHTEQPRMTGVTVTDAQVVPATGTAPEYCQVDGVIVPNQRFRVKLPTGSWLGRYLQYGCGGFCGAVNDPAPPRCPQPMAAGFVVASTDDGHAAGEFDGSWGADQAARDSFAWRAPHALADAAKSLQRAFYGQGPRHSYFSGCSDGGREGMLLAQRYPKDFDGIAAGSPGNYWAPLLAEFQTWIARANLDATGHPVLTADRLPALHNAVLAACDGLDGLPDGVLDDPAVCGYDPAPLRCAAGRNDPGCLTDAQVAVVRKLYAGPTDASGRKLYPAGEPRGSELAWSGWLLAGPGESGPSRAYQLADNYLRYLAYPRGTPGSSVAAWRFDVASFQALAHEGALSSAMSPNLTAFRAHGGRLLIWHGLADAVIPPGGSLDYYQRVATAMGGLAQTRQWARLFLVPGLFHCSGGDGAVQIDPVAPLVAWVESGQAPQRLDASSADGRRTRPVFSYPNRAVYRGSGNPDDAASFIEAGQRPSPATVRWVGETLY